MAAHDILKLNDTDLHLNDSHAIEDDYSFLNSSLTVKQFHTPAPYFGDYLKVYYNGYLPVHGYLSVIICVYGIIANILNITVLTRKSMVSSINAILTGLAVADMFLMVLYLPFVYHRYIRDISEVERYSYGWVIFNLVTVNWNVVNHSISTWLTVTVAIWRYIAVSFPLKSASWCSMTRAKYAIAATYVTCAIGIIPNLITLTVSESKCTDGEIIYKIGFRSFSDWYDQLLDNIILFFFSVLIKFVPCVALTALSLGLIRALNQASKTRQILKHKVESDKAQDRTTKMLLAVVLLFLLTQLPQGIIVLLGIFLGKEFHVNVFDNLDETMDALSLINSSINFIIYCSMSKKFRDTFSLLFIPKCIRQQEIVSIAKSPKTSFEVCKGQSYKIRQTF